LNSAFSLEKYNSTLALFLPNAKLYDMPDTAALTPSQLSFEGLILLNKVN